MNDGRDPALDVNQTEQDSQHLQRGAAETVKRKAKKKKKMRAAEGAADSKAG
jgi:hypothetical protein